MLISDTGGGHRASANALKEAMEVLRPDGKVEFSITDIWTEYGVWPSTRMARQYQLVARLCGHPQLGFFARMLWRLTFFVSPLAEVPWSEYSHLINGRKFRKCLREYDPDIVVSLHPLTQHLPLRVLRRMERQRALSRPRVPFCTVVTDLATAHPAWFHSRVDATFVPSDRLFNHARRRGIPAERLRLHGLPTRKAFWRGERDAKHRKASEAETKALNLKPGKSTVLVIGGGDGAGGIYNIVEACAKQLATECPGQGQVVALCGKNGALVSKLEAARGAWGEVHVEVRGFTNKVSEYMHAADCVVTKAGPGTIAEAAIRGLPTMLSSYLPGQEYGNIAFVVDNGFGGYNRSPKGIAETVCSWCKDEALLESMSERALAVAHSDATLKIAEDVLLLADASKDLPPRGSKEQRSQGARVPIPERWRGD
jgi:1,2-diacylglycerol 3-beta-galactosyltransferase